MSIACDWPPAVHSLEGFTGQAFEPQPQILPKPRLVLLPACWVHVSCCLPLFSTATSAKSGKTSISWSESHAETLE